MCGFTLSDSWLLAPDVNLRPTMRPSRVCLASAEINSAQNIRVTVETIAVGHRVLEGLQFAVGLIWVFGCVWGAI